jgi:hypothetical protein
MPPAEPLTHSYEIAVDPADGTDFAVTIAAKSLAEALKLAEDDAPTDRRLTVAEDGHAVLLASYCGDNTWRVYQALDPRRA